jgi:hypothetical protein
VRSSDDGSLKRIKDIDEDTRSVIVGLEVTEIFDGSEGKQRHVIGLMKKVKLSDRRQLSTCCAGERELAEYFANHKRGDRLLESLVAAGAPSCILFGPKDERRDSRRR